VNLLCFSFTEHPVEAVPVHPEVHHGHPGQGGEPCPPPGGGQRGPGHSGQSETFAGFAYPFCESKGVPRPEWFEPVPEGVPGDVRCSGVRHVDELAVGGGLPEWPHRRREMYAWAFWDCIIL
jgi:hypothetical protein